MMAFQQIVLAVNILLVLAFGFDCLVIDRPNVKPRVKARIGVFLTGLFLTFLILLLLFAVSSVLLKRNALYLALSVYAIIPFAIGRFASYRTLRFYALLQILALLFSAATLVVI